MYSIIINCIALFVLGGLFVYFYIHKNTDGTLVVDTSDPEKDKYMLNVSIPLDNIPKRKIIILKVEVKTNSQEIHFV